VRVDFIDRRILVEIEAEATAPAGSRPGAE
jgi:hypothetical protein